MFERDTRFALVLTPELIEAANRNARRERSKAFHEYLGAIGAVFRGVPKRPDADRFALGEGGSTRSC